MSRARTITQRSCEGKIAGLDHDLHPVIERILLGRGVRDGTSLSLGLGALRPPTGMRGLKEAAGLLADAVMQEQSILVVGDFDADGATGTALALSALRAMGCRRVTYRVPNRFEFGYGLSVPLVDSIAPDLPDVLVTVDSGINCLAGVSRASELGCSVIVTDHHLPGKELPPADAIVNPNVPGDDFPSKNLAGVGVMFYLLSALRGTLRDRGWFSRRRPEPNLAQYLDLVALGTVADLVPLDHNNRVLVHQGLELIRRGRARPGLMALLRAGNRDYRFVNASDLGFAVGPRLNAAGRLEDMAAGIRCLLSEQRAEADVIAADLDALNRQRREMQEAMQDEAMRQVSALLESLERKPMPGALCLFNESWHQGIVGLVASRVKDAVHRPVIAFAPESEGARLLKGSARSVRGLHIRDALALVDSRRPGLLKAFGGHAMAAGMTLDRKNLPALRAEMNEAVHTLLDGEELGEEIFTDGELEGADLGLDLALQIEAHGPWGQRFPEPLFDGRFEIVERRVVGGAHLKMILQPSSGGREIDAIAFGRLPGDLPESGAVRFLYRLDVNRWRGRESPQLLVEHIIGG